MDFSEQLFAKFSGYRLFCGFSGGADSTAALLLARKFQEHSGFALEAVHFNHHLRGAESDREAEEAGKFAAALGVPFHCIDLTLPPGKNLENAAREARLAAWKKFLPEKSAVILGHHAGDRRENLLIRLLRGANSWGVSSMRAVSEVDGMTFIRPLLQMTRQEIEVFLKAQGVTCWAEDSSNTSETFLRNYLRHTLLPELENHFPGSLKGIDRAISALGADADFINAYVSAIPEQNRSSIAFWRQQHDAVKIRLLRDLTGTIPTHDLLERVNRELERVSGELRRIPVSQGIEIHLRNDLICKGSSRRIPPQPFFWEWKKNAAVTRGIWHFTVSEVSAAECCSADSAFFDADKLPGVLEIGSPLPGDRLIPFGSRTAVKIKKLRTDRHISSESSFPVVRAGGEICWAPMIRNSAMAAVTEKTVRIVKFEFKEMDRK